MIEFDEIETCFNKAKPELVAALSIRVILRMVPILAFQNNDHDEPFWYWEGEFDDDIVENADSYAYAQSLLAVLMQLRFSFALTAFFDVKKKSDDLFFESYLKKYSEEYLEDDYRCFGACDAANDDPSSPVALVLEALKYSVILIAQLLYYKIDADFLEDAMEYNDPPAVKLGELVLDGIHAFGHALFDKQPIINEIEHDLNNITSQNAPSCLDFLTQPLWNNNIPQYWLQIWEKFSQWMDFLEGGFEIWFAWYQDRIIGKTLDIGLLRIQLEIPYELIEQGAVEVNAYLAQREKAYREKKILKPLNLVRAIFIGSGSAGKTSLIRALHGEKVLQGKEDMTPGIAIREWPIGNSDIFARFWDFGGQVMTHSTHQFFLRERCLYVLVMDARTEFNANEQAEYWLEHVKAFGKNASVMLVGNKADLTSVNIDMNALKEKYPNIIDFYPISCTHYKGKFRSRFETFRDDFIVHLKKIGTHKIEFTERQFSVLKSLRNITPKKALISQNDFDAICSKFGVSDKGVLNRNWLVDLLDKLGEVVHFPQIARSDSYVLNPRWLTYGVYTLLYSSIIENGKGRLTEKQIFNILRDKKVEDEFGNILNYPKGKCGFIIDAMEEFKLCYRLPQDRKVFVIPDKLPPEQPILNFNKKRTGTLSFEFAFKGFLPRHVMPMIIVARHFEINGDEVWQQGVVLNSKSHSAIARIQVDYHLRVLNVWIQGDGKKEFLAILRDEILKILKRMESLDYSERITLPLEACDTAKFVITKQEKASFQQILANVRKKQMNYISESGVEYDLNIVIGEIMTKQNISKEGITINVDNRDQSVTNGPRVAAGDGNNYSGNFTVADTIQNSFKSVDSDGASAEIKEQLNRLCQDMQTIITKLPVKDQEEVAQDLSTFVSEATKPNPREKWLKLSSEGLIGAAKTVAGISSPVIEVVKKIGQLACSTFA